MRIKIIKYLFLLCIICASVDGFTQQDPQYNMYMFNPLAVNPAYAGSRDALSLALINRTQWVGFNGAPRTQNFAIHSPLAGNKMGLGLEVTNDKIGPKNTLSISFDYAYRIKLGRGNLGFGLRSSLYNYRFNWDEIDYKENQEPTEGVGRESYMAPSFDFGIYYSDNKQYVGIEATHLTEDRLGELSGNINLSNTVNQQMHYTLTAGRAFKINKNLVLKPSVLTKAAINAPVLLDINASVFMFEKVWLGLSYRKSYGMSFISEYYLTQEIRIGYSYDMPFNELSSSTNGSHEIFLGFDFNVFNSKVISPRYF
jgi:type IX secretion system PorP/SprF family membrane protein